MEPESRDYEEKSRLTWSKRDRLKVVKTVVAMANSDGGELMIESFEGNPERLDSARLDDLVNAYVAPRVEGITSAQGPNGTWRIGVPRSEQRPHIFVKEGSYVDGSGRNQTAFYPGQVYARHSSKAEPATDDDLRDIVQEHVGKWLNHVATAIRDFSLELEEGGAELPVRLAEAGTGLKIAVRDPNRDYPYTAKTLGQQIDKDQNWVAKAALVLGLKDDPTYSLTILGASEQVVVRRYNEMALETLRRRLETDPAFNPYQVEDTDDDDRDNE